MTESLELRRNMRFPQRRDVWIDGTFYETVGPKIAAALANPPRYELPPGVIAGSDGHFYAPGDVVRTLPDEMWTRHAPHVVREWKNEEATNGYYEVRPTAANPLKPLPEHTFPLPDGTLACFRRDAAKLREAGATLRYTVTGDEATEGCDYSERDAEVLRVKFPPTPKTERVPWWAAIGRTEPGGNVFDQYGRDGRGRWLSTTGNDTRLYTLIDADGTVEVLLTDTER